MVELGLDAEAVELRQIETGSEAEHESFVGSPTIRVDGADVQAPLEAEPRGLSCRVYRHRDGRVSPLPDPDDLRAALGRARSPTPQEDR